MESVRRKASACRCLRCGRTSSVEAHHLLVIVIGITTVVTVSSVAHRPAQRHRQHSPKELGPNTIFLKRFSGDPSQQGTPKERKRRPIPPEYAEYIKRFCPSLEQVSVALWVPPVVRGKAMSARVRGFETDSFTLAGASPNSRLVQPRLHSRAATLPTMKTSARREWRSWDR